MSRYFTFIGITTTKSSIMRIFPRWRDLLGLGADVEMLGWDLPLRAPAEQYRAAVMQLKNDPDNLGALVTTHKMDLYQATHDLFMEVDSYTQLLNEVSCIAKRDGKLFGWAKDPITAGRSLDNILGPGYFGRTGGHVLIFGAGGSGVAITTYLLTRPAAQDRPQRIVITARNASKLEHLQALQRQLPSDVSIEYVQNADPLVNDKLVAQLPPSSVVINATGMGKDIPGSPITAAARFPEQSIAWELNYRGELDFLHQALAQPAERAVQVVDGWKYFIFGWTAVIEEVFQRPISDDELTLLEREAAFARSPQAPR
jgi:shikimate 5-dehydrogenase